jgi:hypothetical protein
MGIFTRNRLVGLFALALIVCAVVAQDGKKPRREEEDDGPPPAKVKPKQKKEEEEEGKPKSGKSPVLDIDDDEKGKPPAPRPAQDLAAAAREARHPAIKALFTDLATPSDVLTLWVDVARKKTEVVRARPIGPYYVDRKEVKEPLNFTPLDGGEERTAPPHAVLSIRYHEQAASEEVRKFLGGGFDSLPAGDVYRLERFQMLVAAEAALSAVIRFHLSARERGVRTGDWSEPEQALRRQLVEALLGQLSQLTENRAWDAGFDTIRRLANAVPRVPGAENARAVRAVTDFLTRALSDEAFSGAKLADLRERGRQLEPLFPGSGLFAPVKARCEARASDLLARARALVKEAEALEKAGNKADAARKRSDADAALRQAQDVWPELPGLPAAISTLAGATLRVGARELPELMSPARAASEADHRSLDLLYESLTLLAPDAEGRLHYRSQLALGRPEVMPLARRFVLPDKARWSDGSEMHAAAAIRSTVRWLAEGRGGGRLAALGDMLDERVSFGGRADVVILRLKRGAADPLGFMTFKILPVGHHTEAFARKPIGSGPFSFARADNTDPATGRRYVSFLRNDHYGAHPGRLGQPYISEVQWSSPPDAAEALIQDQVDLALDLDGAQADRLKKAGYEAPIPRPGENNRRIHFLAVNHRKPILAEPAMRLALARAIPREKILDRVYRKGLSYPAHVALNGPYPVLSWASDPELALKDGKPHADPYDADLARAKFKEAQKKAGVGDVLLRLKYPEGSKELDAAMKEVCAEAMASLPGLTLLPVAVRPADFRRDLEEARDFDLAYGYHDFDAAFWLAPLLEAGPGGDNWMGYTGPLVRDAQMAADVRYFAEARKKSQEIHRKFLSQEMPFIPLWQLTPLMAWRKGRLETPPLDPCRPFARIAEWKVKR